MAVAATDAPKRRCQRRPGDTGHAREVTYCPHESREAIWETVGNLLWLVVCGVWFALGWLVWALILAVTFVGRPFAPQCVELARFSLWPFRRTIVTDPTGTQLGTVGAILWTVPGALMAIG